MIREMVPLDGSQNSPSSTSACMWWQFRIRFNTFKLSLRPPVGVSVPSSQHCGSSLLQGLGAQSVIRIWGVQTTKGQQLGLTTIRSLPAAMAVTVDSLAWAMASVRLSGSTCAVACLHTQMHAFRSGHSWILQACMHIGENTAHATRPERCIHHRLAARAAPRRPQPAVAPPPAQGIPWAPLCS